MKKLLSIVLAATMTIGSFGFAIAAPVDVEGTQYADAVNRLSALEILNGYEDGTFKPEKTITRAEFAKVMVTTLGVGNAAKYANGQVKFNDVPSNHWASGYINLAADLGVINGYGDGNFGPSDQVTYAQAITMIVRALGYEPKAKALGGYPGGYIAIASEKDITDDVKVVNNSSALRGDVAIMVDNSLDVAMMVQTSFGNNPEWKEDASKTILKEKHNIQEYTGTVVATDRVDSSLEAKEIRFESKDLNGDLTLVTDANPNSLLGMEVSLWANKDKEVFLLEKSTEDDDIKLGAITEVKDSTLKADGKEYDLASDVKVYLNFNESADVESLKSASDSLYGYAILNNKGDVVAINAIESSFIDNGFVTKVAGDEVTFVDTEAGNDGQSLDLDDYKDGVVFLDKNLNEISKDELKAGVVINAFKDKDSDLDKLYVVVSNDSVEGKLERVKTKEVQIGDKKYDVAANMMFSTDADSNFAEFTKVTDLDDINGEEIKASLNLSGDVIILSGDVKQTSSTSFGIVTYGEQGSTSKATVFNKDGNETEYKFESRSEGTPLTGLNYFGTGNSLSFGIMKYKLNSDGEIAADKNSVLTVDMSTKKITQSGEAVEAISTKVTKKANSDYVLINKGKANETRYYITKDTVFMKAVDGGKLDPEVLSYDDIYDIEISSNGDAIVFAEEGRDADMIVFINSDFEGVKDDNFYGIVTEEASKAGSKYLITVDIAGEGTKEVEIDSNDIADLTVGSVIEFKYDSKGQVVVNDKNTTVKVDNTSSVVSYDDGYLNVNGKYIKVADDSVVYDVDSYKTEADKMVEIDLGSKKSLSKVKNYNTVVYLLNGDEQVVAVLVADEK